MFHWRTLVEKQITMHDVVQYIQNKRSSPSLNLRHDLSMFFKFRNFAASRSYKKGS